MDYETRTLNLVPNTPEWHEHRLHCNNASDAPAMYGCSPHTTRGELVRAMALGLRGDPTYWQQRLYDRGHEHEALYRPRAAGIIGDVLQPIVLARYMPPGLLPPGVTLQRMLSASYDGLPIEWDAPWEHKMLNDAIRSTFPHWSEMGVGPDVPPATIAALIRDSIGDQLALYYRVQMEHQMAVCGAKRTLFTASSWKDGRLVEERVCWYHSDRDLQQDVLAHWGQLERDVLAYDPASEPAPAIEILTPQPTPAPLELPPVVIEAKGALAVTHNLKAMAPLLAAYIARQPKEPETDEDFGALDAAAKRLEELEKSLQSEETRVLRTMADVDAMRTEVANLVGTAKAARLAFTNTVSTFKQKRKDGHVLRGRKAVEDHVQALNTGLGGVYVQVRHPDFGTAIKGLRSMKSIREKVDALVAAAKVQADATAATVRTNMQAFADLVKDDAKALLFRADKPQLLLRDPDACRAIITARIAEWEAAEAKRLAQQATPAPTAAPTPAPTAAPTPAPTPAPAPSGDWTRADTVVAMHTTQTLPLDDDPFTAPAPAPGTQLVSHAQLCNRLGVLMPPAFVASVLEVQVRTAQRNGETMYTLDEAASVCFALADHASTTAAEYRAQE